MGECAEHNDKHNGRGDPAPILIHVDKLVTGKGDEECAECDDEDTGVSGNFGVHCVEELGTDNSVGSRPTDTGDNVKDSN